MSRASMAPIQIRGIGESTMFAAECLHRTYSLTGKKRYGKTLLHTY